MGPAQYSPIPVCVWKGRPIGHSCHKGACSVWQNPLPALQNPGQNDIQAPRSRVQTPAQHHCTINNLAPGPTGALRRLVLAAESLFLLRAPVSALAVVNRTAPHPLHPLTEPNPR